MTDEEKPIGEMLNPDGTPIRPGERPSKKKKTLPEALRKAMWKPGTSGNPGGRPKGILKKLRHVLAQDLGDGSTLEDLVVRRYLECALHPKHPDRQALIDLINRIEGKPTQNITIGQAPVVRVYDQSCNPALALEAPEPEATPDPL